MAHFLHTESFWPRGPELQESFHHTPAVMEDAEQTLLALACNECLGCEGLDWACLRLKVALVARIQQEMRRQGLSQTAAAHRMGISQPEVSRLLSGKLRHTSERKLMSCLTRLGFDIELNIRPAQAATGQLRLQG